MSKRVRTADEDAWIEEHLSTLPEFGPETRKRLSSLLGQLRPPARNDVRRGEVRPA